MAERKDLIVSKLSPKIPLKEVWSADEETPSLRNPIYKGGKGTADPADSIGAESPYVMINEVPIAEIEYLVIDETDVIPKIKLIFKDSRGELSGPYYPKNNPIASVYLKPQNPNIKPIRCDFLITSIKSNQDAFFNRNNLESGATFIMSGELFIPKIYNNSSKSYRDLTSREALLRVAEDTDLGYANNEFITDDKMTWINPNRNHLWFINHISKHAYLNDDTFFKAFIDKYYHLNFINIPEQLNPSSDLMFTYVNTVNSAQYEASRLLKEKIEERNSYEDLDIISFTNTDAYKNKPNYIINYSLIGDNGRILKNKGYKRKIYYYDHTIYGDKFISFYVNPIKIKGYNQNDKLSSLIPDDDVLKESVVKKWMNIDYGNTHREWNASVLINDHNNSELEKIKLKIETQGINFQLTRGIGVPVSISIPADKYIQKSSRRLDKDMNNITEKLDVGKMVVDDSISGKYMINGIKYIYDTADEYNLKTEFQMVRMNWIGEKNIIEQ